jgi:Nickel responsive protein SCO4226-like
MLRRAPARTFASVNQQGGAMPTFLIEREIPGASKLTDDELRGITTKSNDTVVGLQRPYTWRHSYVAGDKIYCIHDAERAEDVIEHARTGGFPANLVVEVSRVFDSTGPRELPV